MNPMMVCDRRRVRRLVLMAIVVTVLGGCAVWSRIDAASVTQEGPGGKFRIQAPVGWVRLNAVSDSIVISRDGIPIQHIQITQQEEADFFKHTRVKLPPGVLPSDLAQMVLAELRSDKALQDMVVIEVAPHTVAGVPGFKAHIRYRDDRGTRFDRIVLGAAKGREVVTLIYHALHTHYFSRDLPLFYAVADSFR
jgi:hypothetical protein